MCLAEEVESLRTRHSKTVSDADCTYTTTFGRDLHYKSHAGRWEEVNLDFRREGAGYVADRNNTVVAISGARVDVAARDTGVGIRWLLPAPPAVEGSRARFRGHGLDWEYAVTKSGVKLVARVANPRGPQSYVFSYQLLGGAGELQVDEGGNLVGDGFSIPRALAIGADGEIYPGGAWELLPGHRAAFEFDDSALPEAAFPYDLDPSTTFHEAQSDDDGWIYKYGYSYPPTFCNGWYSGNYATKAYRGYNGSQYGTINAFMRWSTGSLPDDATVTSAKLRLFVESAQDASNSRAFTADWYNAWPIDCADHSDYAQTSALTGVLIKNIVPMTSNEFDLTSTSGISLTGYTGMRAHISGGAPTTENYVGFYEYGNFDGYPEPRLAVTYTTPNTGPTSTYASDSPDPVTEGGSVNFNVGWTDPNQGDSARALICKTAGLSVSGTCWNGTWASGSYSATSPAVATYSPTAADVGTQTYYAYACDTWNVCSGAIEGSFQVLQANRAPTLVSASDSPDPVTPGNQVNFTLTWTDPNPGDAVRGLICKTSSISAGACTGGDWTSSSASTSSPARPVYTASTADVGTRTYYPFVCDQKNACSGLGAGTFTVVPPNAAPSIGQATDGPDPVTAGRPITFSVSWGDSNGDSAKVLICKTNAVSGSSCPGGTWASSAFSSTSPTQVTYTTSSVDAGARNYYAFVCDSLGACSSSSAGTFTVRIDGPPTITSAYASPNPVTEGGQVTFTVGWNDPDDSVRAVVCRTNAISGGFCQGGTLASGNPTQTSPSTATYNTSASDAGAMTYYAFACDAANACSSGASGTVTVNALPPPAAPEITDMPEDPTRAPTLTYRFQGGSGGVSFECSLTGPSGTVSPFSPCASPKGYNSSGLSPGLYVFEVRAVSAAGRRSAASDEEIAVHFGDDEAEVEESPYEADADAADAQAQQFSGSRHAGSWQTYSPDRTINLHVAVARMTPIDEFLIEALTRTGVVVTAHRVEYSTTDLERFAGAVTPVDKSRGFATFIDVDHNSVVLEVEDPSGTQSGQPAADLGSSIPANAIEARWVRSVAAFPGRAATRSTYPFYKAGKRWGFKERDARCGVAFAMVLDNGDRVGLTGGHCAAEGNDVYMGTNRKKRVGEIFRDGTDHNDGVVVSDTSLVRVPNDDITPLVFIRRTYSRIVIHADREVRENEEVCMSGAKTGIDCGIVLAKRELKNSEADWKWAQVWCTDITMAKGDSGSPVYRPKAKEHNGDSSTGEAVAIGVVAVIRADDTMCFEAIGQAETQRNAVVWES